MTTITLNRMDAARADKLWKVWLLGGLLVLLPLLTFPLSIFPREFFGDALIRRFNLVFPWARAAFLLSIVLWCWRTAEPEGRFVHYRLPKDWLTVLTAFGLAATASLLGASRICIAVLPLVELISMLGLACVATMWGREAGPTQLVRCVVAATIVVVAYTLLQLASIAVGAMQTGGAIWKALMNTEFAVTFGSRNFLASYLIFSLPFIVCWFGAPSSDTPNQLNRRRWMGSILAAFVLFVLLFCRARAAWGVIVLVSLLAIAVWFANRHPQRAKLIAAGFVILIVAILVLATPFIKRSFAEDVRWEIWRGTTQMALDHPVVGTGIGTFFAEYAPYRTPEYFAKPKAAFFTTHAHNEWLQIWAETGLFGLLTFLAVLVFVARQWWLRRDEMGASNWAFAAAAVILLAHGSVEVNLRHQPAPTLFWLSLGLSLTGLSLPTLRLKLPRQARLRLTMLAIAVSGGLAYFFVWLPLKSDFHYRQSLVAQERNDWREAIGQARAAVTAQPCRIETLYHLAVILGRAGRREAALGDVLFRIKELAPDYRAINSKLGQWLYRQGNVRESIPLLEREVALEVGIPTKPEIIAAFVDDRLWLARAYLDLGEKEKALQTLQSALWIDPQNTFVKDLIKQLTEGKLPP